jgi:hypothetical protein
MVTQGAVSRSGNKPSICVISSNKARYPSVRNIEPYAKLTQRDATCPIAAEATLTGGGEIIFKLDGTRQQSPSTSVSPGRARRLLEFCFLHLLFHLTLIGAERGC